MKISTQHSCKILKDKMYFSSTKKTIPLHEIIMLQGDINYSLIYMQNGHKVMIPRTLKIFEELLGNHHFIRTHRGFIINSIHLQRMDIHREFMLLTNDLKASISRRRKTEVSKRLSIYA